MEQLGRCEHRPHPLERSADLVEVSHRLADLLRRDVVPTAGGEGGPDLALDDPSGGVVAPAPPPSGLDDAAALARPEAQVGGAEGHDQIVAERALTIAHGILDEPAHAGVALHPRRRIGLTATDDHVVHEIGQDDLLDAGLAERREDLLDVAEEHPVRPDHQDTLVLEREAVGVEQVGGAVQRHHGLAGAGTALDDEHARLR